MKFKLNFFRPIVSPNVRFNMFYQSYCTAAKSNRPTAWFNALEQSISADSLSFKYIHKYHSTMPQALLDLFTSDLLFTKTVDGMLTDHLKKTANLIEIRQMYTSDEIKNLITNCIKNYEAEKNEPTLQSYQMHDLARLINKWAARGRMLELGNEKEVGQIHDDNLNRYGNCIGPTPDYLDKKYQTKQEREAACQRFRANLNL